MKILFRRVMLLIRSPAVRISRVVATFSTSRNSVVPSSNAGNTDNSSGERTKITLTRITTASVRFADSRISSIHVGIGIMITMISAMNPAGIIKLRCLWICCRTPAMFSAGRANALANAGTHCGGACHNDSVRSVRRSILLRFNPSEISV